MNYGGLFDIDSINLKVNQLKENMIDISFWDDREKANDIIKEYNNMKNTVEEIKNIKDNLQINLDISNSLIKDFDDSLRKLIEEEVLVLQEKVEKLEVKLFLNHQYDKNNAILEIHAGAGGTEACDWVNMLYRMYLRWCENNDYHIEELDYQPGDEVGIKRVSILIKGEYAYGYLKGEKGVHRLVRISPFDSNSRRHTSFASVDIFPEFPDNINIEIKDEDIKIDVYRSSGSGGQSVNTTDSAVRITHIPTKIIVTCQNERSQIKNRDKAYKILKNKLFQLELEKREQEINDIKGKRLKIEFGSQIRSYIMHPYSMVKDHRTDYSTSNVNKVMDGYVDDFIENYLKYYEE